MISSLLQRPLKMYSSSNSVTPDKENSILRRGVRELKLESPPTDFFKRPAVPLHDMNNPALKRAKEVRSLKRSIVSSPVYTFTDDEDDKLVIDSADEFKEKPSPARVENILPPLKCLPQQNSPSPLNRSQSESSVIMKAVERSSAIFLELLGFKRQHPNLACISEIIFYLIFCLVFVWMVGLTSGAGTEFPSSFENKYLDQVYTRGKEEVSKLQSFITKLPHESCWKSALEDLEISCKQLSQDRQTRLAFTFTACFTDMTGMGTYICEETTDVKDCFRAFDPAIMNIYHSYFLHTHDMCFYLQHQMWQEQTEMAVNQLTSAAVDVAQTLHDSRTAQEQILESQMESAKVQSNLLKDNNVLYTKILGFKQVFEEFRASADEHRIIFFEMFEKLTRMHKLVSWIQGEMSFFDMMGFYFISLIFGFVATSTQRTHQARFWLVMLLISSLASERYVFQLLADHGKHYTPDEVQYYIWLVRKLSAAVGLFIVLVCAAMYRDYHVLNNNMLSDLHGRVDNLVQFMEDLKSTGTLPKPIRQKEEETTVQTHLTHVSQEEENNGGDSTSSESSFSNYSRDSDREVVENELVADDSDDSFSLDEEIEETPPPEIKTPSFLQNILPMTKKSSNPNPIIDAFNSPPPAPPTQSRVATPFGGLTPGRYNFRERKPRISNEILNSESPTDFAKKLKQSQRNNKAKYQAERSKALSYFSSDDEF